MNWHFWPFWFPLSSLFFLQKMGTRKDMNVTKAWKSQISATLWGLAQVRKVCASQYWYHVIYLHQGWQQNCRFANRWRARVIFGKSPFYLMKSAKNSWFSSGSTNTTVHWVYWRVIFFHYFPISYSIGTQQKKNFKDRSTCTFWTFLGQIWLCAARRRLLAAVAAENGVAYPCKPIHRAAAWLAGSWYAKLRSRVKGTDRSDWDATAMVLVLIVNYGLFYILYIAGYTYITTMLCTKCSSRRGISWRAATAVLLK
jgi:hypothetical protein